MKVLPIAYHYTKAHMFSSCTSAVKLAKITNENGDINFAKRMLSIKNESLNELRKVDSISYQSQLNKNHKLLSFLTAVIAKKSPIFESKKIDLASGLEKALSDFRKNPNKAITKHLNGHININPHSKIGRGYIAYCGKRK